MSVSQSVITAFVSQSGKAPHLTPMRQDAEVNKVIKGGMGSHLSAFSEAIQHCSEEGS